MDSKTWTWKVAVKLSRTRVYCHTVAFAGRVWIVGGDVFDADGKRQSTTLVESYDPKTGTLTREADLPFAIPVPLAQPAAGRLWVVGSRNREDHAVMASIGPGESTWRKEPDALRAMWALCGTSLNDRVYALVPDTGLAEFDPATGRWTIIPGPTKPRSSQIAAWRGEIWIVGGCDLPDWGEVSIYNPTTRTWRSGPALPIQVAWGAAAVVDDQLVVAGGAGVHPTADGRREYDFSDRTFVLAAKDIPPPASLAEAPTLPRWNDSRLSGTGGAGYPFKTEELFPTLKFSQLGSIETIPVAQPNEAKRWLISETSGARTSSATHEEAISQRRSPPSPKMPAFALACPELIQPHLRRTLPGATFQETSRPRLPGINCRNPPCRPIRSPVCDYAQCRRWEGDRPSARRVRQ